MYDFYAPNLIAFHQGLHFLLMKSVVNSVVESLTQDWLQVRASFEALRCVLEQYILCLVLLQIQKDPSHYNLKIGDWDVKN